MADFITNVALAIAVFIHAIALLCGHLVENFTTRIAKKRLFAIFKAGGGNRRLPLTRGVIYCTAIITGAVKISILVIPYLDGDLSYGGAANPAAYLVKPLLRASRVLYPDGRALNMWADILEPSKAVIKIYHGPRGDNNYYYQ